MWVHNVGKERQEMNTDKTVALAESMIGKSCYISFVNGDVIEGEISGVKKAGIKHIIGIKETRTGSTTGYSASSINDIWPQ